MDPVSVDEHLGDVLGRVQPLTPYSQPLLEALGLPIARDVVASRALPPFDNSAMDGYAVRAEDVMTASASTPVRIPVSAEILAGGQPLSRLAPATAQRIMTGAPIPHGADAVVPFEATNSGVGDVKVLEPVVTGQNVRRAGEDVKVGDVLVKAGDRLGPRQIGLLSGAGVEQVLVAPRPRVVVIATGEELVAPGQPLPPGAIHDSNSYLLTAAVRATGAVAYRVVVRSDDPDFFMQTLDDQLVRADLVITTGGVSKGTRDVVKAALRSDPGMWFREVAMQPGKPQGFGFVGADKTPLFALPGNPVSAYVSFVLFVEPALRKLTGQVPESRPLFRAQITAPVKSVKGKRQFLRGHFASGRKGPEVTPIEGQGSHMLGGLSKANALIVVHEDQTVVKSGAAVPVILLDREY